VQNAKLRNPDVVGMGILIVASFSISRILYLLDVYYTRLDVGCQVNFNHGLALIDTVSDLTQREPQISRISRTQWTLVTKTERHEEFRYWLDTNPFDKLRTGCCVFGGSYWGCGSSGFQIAYSRYQIWAQGQFVQIHGLPAPSRSRLVFGRGRSDRLRGDSVRENPQRGNDPRHMSGG